MDRSGASLRSDLHALAAQVATDDAFTRNFVTEALASVDALTAALASADQELTAHSASVFLDDGHRQRLETLIQDQQGTISRLNIALERVRALADLAEWATDLSESPSSGAIQVSDLRRALDG
jgi:hypothetical protein